MADLPLYTEQPNTIISFGNLAYVLTIGCFLLQQIGLLYHMINFIRVLAVVAVFDCIVLFTLLSDRNIVFSTYKGAQSWVLHTWSQVIKVTCFFFFFDMAHMQSTVFRGTDIHGWTLEISLLFLLNVPIYTLLSFKSMEESLQSTQRVGIDNFLHVDCIVHVAFDLLDLVAAFRSYLVIPTQDGIAKAWLRVLIGTVIIVALFFHGYSFPAGAGDRYGVSNTQDISEATSMTRKHAALVGICFVDFPLACLRITSWFFFASLDSFSPFLLKNFCFFPFQFLRIWQCRVATTVNNASGLEGEKITAKKSRTLSTDELQFSHTASSAAPNENGVVARCFRRKSAPRMHGWPVEFLSSESFKKRRARHYDTLWLERMLGTTQGSEIVVETILSNDPHVRSKALSDLQEIDKFVDSCRTFPAEGIRIKIVFKKLLHFYKTSRNRKSLASLLDNHPELQFLTRILMVSAALAYFLSQIGIVVTLYIFEPLRERRVFLWLFDPGNIANSATWRNLPTDMMTCFFIIITFTVLNFVFFVATANLLDVIFVCTLSTLRLFTFFLLILTVRDFIAFRNFMQIFSYSTAGPLGLVSLLIFLCLPLYNILDILYAAISSYLGRKYLTFLVPIIQYESSSKSTKNGLIENFLNEPWNKPNLMTSSADILRDEVFTLSISSLIAFHNAKHMLIPLSLHEILVGPNLIKSMRMNDCLLHVHGRHLLTSVIFSAWCVLLFNGFPTAFTSSREDYNPLADIPKDSAWYNKFLLVQLIFAARIVLSYLYLVVSQTLRLLAMERMEKKAIFSNTSDLHESIIEGHDFNLENGHELMRLLQSEKLLLYCKFAYHSLLTRPGEIFPRFCL